LGARCGARFAVASSGHYPEPGRPSPPAAVEAARAFGVDLSPHRSRVATSAEVGAADLVLVFDDETYRAAVALCPSARRRVFLLGALDGAPAVPDPWGGTVDDFRACYGRLAALVARLCEGGAA